MTFSPLELDRKVQVNSYGPAPETQLWSSLFKVNPIKHLKIRFQIKVMTVYLSAVAGGGGRRSGPATGSRARSCCRDHVVGRGRLKKPTLNIRVLFNMGLYFCIINNKHVKEWSYVQVDRVILMLIILLELYNNT